MLIFAGYKLRVTSYGGQITNYEINYELRITKSITNYELRNQLRITNYELRVTGYELRVTGYGLRVNVPNSLSCKEKVAAGGNGFCELRNYLPPPDDGKGDINIIHCKKHAEGATSIAQGIALRNGTSPETTSPERA